MKQTLLFVILFILNWNSLSAVTRPVKNENPALWLITAKVTSSSTLQHDTVMKFDMGGHISIKESHTTARTNAEVQVTAVVENQAEDPATGFLFISDSGDPVSINVSGSGMHLEDSKYKETIDGKLISEDDRNINVSGSPLPQASIQFGYSADGKYAEISAYISAKGTDKGRMFYDEWKDYGGNVKDYSISCSSGCDLSSDKGCTVTKTSKGYQASWSFSESKQVHSAGGTDFVTEKSSLEVTVVPYKESDKPTVTIDGCTDPGTGETSTVKATAKPSGGSYKFWVEPSDLMTVSASEATASLTGKTPGRGMLMVEYTSPDGKTAQTSMEAACVKIESYNGGQAIPEIALYDIDGKKQSGIKTVPVQAQPSDAGDLVKFEAADPGVLSAVGTGSEVTLQGLQVGKTTLQAKTKCGEKTGPEVEVEVVKCDEETIKTLERMREAATENLIEASEKMQKDAGSEEFQEARDELVKSTAELLLKSGLTILGSGHVHGSAETAIEIAEAAESAIDILGSADSKQFAERSALTVLKALGTSVVKAAAGAVGVHEAAKKFGEIVGEILKHEDVMEGDSKNFEQAYRNLERIAQRQEFCKGEKTEKPKKDEPKSEPKQEPAKPKPPTKPDPKPDQPPTPEPQPDDPASDDEVFVDPEPPTIPPKLVGLPYEPESCGCGSESKITNNSKGFAEIGTGIKNLGNCVEKFQNTSLADYQNALQEMTQLTDSLTNELASGNAGFAVKAKESQGRFGSLVSRVRSYDKAGTEFLKTMEKCPQSVTSGMEIFKSVEKITIDSIKTKY
jgi:hypothetical protein